MSLGNLNLVSHRTRTLVSCLGISSFILTRVRFRKNWNWLFWVTILFSHFFLIFSVSLIEICLDKHFELSRNSFHLFFGSFLALDRLSWAKTWLGIDDEYLQHQSRGSGYTSIVLTTSLTCSLGFSMVNRKRIIKLDPHTYTEDTKNKSSVSIHPLSVM